MHGLVPVAFCGISMHTTSPGHAQPHVAYNINFSKIDWAPAPVHSSCQRMASKARHQLCRHGHAPPTACKYLVPGNTHKGVLQLVFCHYKHPCKGAYCQKNQAHPNHDQPPCDLHGAQHGRSMPSHDKTPSVTQWCITSVVGSV